MKKGLLLLLIGAVIGAAALVCVGYFIELPPDWKSYTEGELIPCIASSVAGIATLYIGALPLLRLIRAAILNLFTATDKIEKTAENGEQNEARLIDYEHRISALDERLDGLRHELSSISAAELRIEEILCVGLCNIDELVKKGYAAEIGRICKEDERRKG